MKTPVLSLYVAGKDGRVNFPLFSRDYREPRLRSLLIPTQNHRIKVFFV